MSKFYPVKLIRAVKPIVGLAVILVLIGLAPVSVGQRTFVNITAPSGRETQGGTRAVKGVYLHSRSISSESAGDWAETLTAHGFNAVVINVKNVHGEVTYPSEVELASEIGATTGRLDITDIISRLHREGIYVIARLACFKDRLMAARCCGGGEWTDPADELAQEYNVRLAREVSKLGFDEIQLDYIRYPDGPGKIGGDYSDRSEVISDFVERVKRAIGAQVRLSADVYGRTIWNWNSKNTDPIGQNLDYLGDTVDVLSPMIYPSHYNNPDLVYNPNKLVKLSLKTGKERLSTELRPFIQGFERAMPRGMDLVSYIQEELRALESHEGTGFLVWNPSSNYESLWKAVKGING
ncbi:putative glycoside hydrolase [Candidatus Bipolaricaulota bacterium]|nr:putative glycoside hydrolase [Candidatus Bipolaricaulota bacterium]